MKYDVAIIGGGPAGLMAACRAGELGLKAVVIEKNSRPGIKLLATGGGRCNITNRLEGLKDMAARYYPDRRFLISALSAWGPQEVINFFESRGLATKEENGGRIFPQSDRATDILDILLKTAIERGGEIRTGAAVREVRSTAGLIDGVLLESGENIKADKYLIACGGKSYPRTGSNGEAYRWLEDLGHTIIAPRPGLVPIVVKEKVVRELEGLSLDGVELRLLENKKVIAETQGGLVFTANGLSGPAILNISRFISQAKDKSYELSLDLFPDLTDEQLSDRLQSLFHGGRKLFKNVLEGILPPKLLPILIGLSGADPEKQANSITGSERTKLVALLKNLSFSIVGTGNFDQAMITVGGVSLWEIDPKTMRSKIVPNLYFAGEIIDLAGPTGGYNLQLCWSTGYAAASSLIDKRI